MSAPSAVGTARRGAQADADSGPASDAAPDLGPVRFGILGAASIAARKTLPAMLAEPGVRPVAIASRDHDRARRLAERFGCAAVSDYRELLRHPEVEAVYLPLPTGLHAEWARQVLLAGRHVLVEKPLASSYRQASELVELARQRDLVLAENFAFLEHDQHRRVRGLLASGAVGTVRAISAEFGIPPLPQGDIRYDRTLGGGALLDTGVYPIRAATMLLGPGLRVLGATVHRPDAHTVDLAGAALLAGARGVTAALSFGFTHAYRSSYTVWGSTGVLSVERAYTAPPELVPSATVQDGDGRRPVELAADDQFAGRLRRFAVAVRSCRDRRSFDAEVLEQARLVEAVRCAAGLTGDH